MFFMKGEERHPSKTQPHDQAFEITQMPSLPLTKKEAQGSYLHLNFYKLSQVMLGSS